MKKGTKRAGGGRASSLFCLPVKLEGLESRQLLSSVVATPCLDPLASSSSNIAGYTPSQISTAYGFNQVSFGSTAAVGTGQTIAIVDAYSDPNIASDLNTFDSQFGLKAAPSFKVENETGGTALPAANPGWSMEISLDVEWAHAVAPGANILLVEANSSSLSDLLTGVATASDTAGVSVVSMSWGSGEFRGENSYDSYFTTPSGHTPVTFVAASGDEGSSRGVEWPATSPNVVSVGGTTLNVSTTSGTYSSETGWSDSTGGYSALEAEPSYQDSVQTSGRRSSPDVAYDANPNTGVAVYDSVNYEGYVGWEEIGGTSEGAPQWSALLAIADQGRAINKLSALNGASGTLPGLYSLYSTHSSDFHDITSGSTSRFISAGPGYDLVTGMGSPKANLIIPALASGSTVSSSSTSNSGSAQNSLARPSFSRPSFEQHPTNAPTATTPSPAPVVQVLSAAVSLGSQESTKVFAFAAEEISLANAAVSQTASYVGHSSAGVDRLSVGAVETATFSVLPMAVQEFSRFFSTAAHGITLPSSVAPMAQTVAGGAALASASIDTVIARPTATAGRALLNLFHVDAAATFGDALGALIDDSANLPAARAQYHARAWMITGAVVAADAALIGYWFATRPPKEEQQKKAVAKSISPLPARSPAPSR